MQYLEEIQACAGGGAVGAEAEANTALHHFQNAGGAHAVIVQRAMASGDIALRIEIDFAIAEQDGVRGVDVVDQGFRLLEIFGGSLAPSGDGVVHFIGSFGQVRVDGGVESVGELAHALA